MATREEIKQRFITRIKEMMEILQEVVMEVKKEKAEVSDEERLEVKELRAEKPRIREQKEAERLFRANPNLFTDEKSLLKLMKREVDLRRNIKKRIDDVEELEKEEQRDYVRIIKFGGEIISKFEEAKTVLDLRGILVLYRRIAEKLARIRLILHRNFGNHVEVFREIEASKRLKKKVIGMLEEKEKLEEHDERESAFA